jgi:hypothetical protein
VAEPGADRPPARQPGANQLRARRLLLGGLAGGHLTAVVAVVACWVAGGLLAGVSAALGAFVTLAFFTIGQGVQVLVAEAPPKQVLLAALASYGVRVSALGLLLMLALAHPERLGALQPVPVVIGTIAVVVGWLAGEIRVHSRLRIPVFDSNDAR